MFRIRITSIVEHRTEKPGEAPVYRYHVSGVQVINTDAGISFGGRLESIVVDDPSPYSVGKEYDISATAVTLV